MATMLVRNEGFIHLYDGLSASLLRQATYSTVRFGAYDFLKANLGFSGECTNAAFPVTLTDGVR